MADKATTRDRYKKVSTALGLVVSGPGAVMIPANIRSLLGETVLLLGDLVERLERLEGTD